MAVDEVNRIQQLIDSNGISDQLFSQDLEAHLILTKALNAQETIWREKARNHNFINGGRNTSYFHRMIQVRAVSKNLTYLQDGDLVITNATEIESHVLAFFQSIFSVDNDCAENTMVS